LFCRIYKKYFLLKLDFFAMFEEQLLLLKN